METPGLSSFLLKTEKGKKKAAANLDADLDALFQSSAKFAPVPGPSRQPAAPKPTDAPSSHKRTASESQEATPSKKKKRKAAAVEAPEPEAVAASDSPEAIPSRKKRRKSSTLQASDPVEATPAKSLSPEPSNVPEAEEPEHEESESDDQLPVHESTLKGSDETPRKSKFVPEDETKEMRDKRTIFVGNVPVDAAKTKSGRNALTRHITTHVPGCKVESVRFRSVAFKTPSSKLPDDKSAEDAKKQDASREQQRQRTAQWRAENDQESSAPAKVFLTKEAKKKVSFIKKDFHPEGEVVNAYVVFAHSDPGRSKNVPPIMDPIEAAEKAVAACDATVFMGHTIHVDRVGQSDNSVPRTSNNKNVVFVGNLDFEAKEEELRTYFESLASTELSLVVAELGSESLIKTVRIVRDRDTRLGKGFAYVEFATREAADAVLALDESKVKFAKRKLRLQRCKTLPGASASKVPKTAPSSTTQTTPRLSKPTPAADVPLIRGDPTLGDKLKDMSKEDRKAVKLANADRVARRLQKKKARNKLEQQGVAVPGKDRSRQRTKPTQHKEDRKGAPKTRIRSDKLISKRNTKK